jgi:hypothetical protein
VARFGTTPSRCIHSSILLVFVGFAIIALAWPMACAAQEQKIAIEGYITAVHMPIGFDVNGEHVAASAATTFGMKGDKEASSDSPLKSAVEAGAYVYVWGERDSKSKSVIAESVRFRDDGNRKLSGLGVIDKVISTGQQTIFRADGYRIRIAPQTEVLFQGDLKTLADVGTNAWMRYEGQRDRTGDLVAASVQFLPAKPVKVKAVQGLEVSQIEVKTSDPSRNQKGMPGPLADNGSLRPNDKVKMGPFTHWRTILDDPALQERVRRVGMSVVPEYQQKLPEDHPSKIHFSFYVVDDDRTPGEVLSLDGLVLTPKVAMDRLGSDAQLAAVLADGVAFNLQRQAAKMVAANRAVLGGEAAALVAGAFVPGLGLAMLVGEGGALGKALIAMEEQRGRVALSLMADAGFDPWQAPEAWRLMAPKKLPADLDTLKYPNLSAYQLGILNLQYRQAAGTAGSVKSVPESH